MTRIRQLVIAGKSAETADRLSKVLGLGEPFADPGVAEFGLDNAVFAIGDQFLEVVWPVVETAPAQRFMDRNGGEGGYMAIFETGDLSVVRQRAEHAGVRAVWNIDLDDISASHFHPADMGAAIVSVDQPIPAGEWRWGGPDWRGRASAGRLVGATLESPDPAGLAKRWADILGASTVSTETGAQIAIEDGVIDVVYGDKEHLAAFHVAVMDPDATRARLGPDESVGGVRLVLSAD